MDASCSSPCACSCSSQCCPSPAVPVTPSPCPALPPHSQLVLFPGFAVSMESGEDSKSLSACLRAPTRPSIPQQILELQARSLALRNRCWAGNAPGIPGERMRPVFTLSAWSQARCTQPGPALPLFTAQGMSLLGGMEQGKGSVSSRAAPGAPCTQGEGSQQVIGNGEDSQIYLSAFFFP